MALALFLGRSTAWMLGSTPPWAIVTPASSLFSSSSFLNKYRERIEKLLHKRPSPDGKLQVPGDDARLLVVSGSVTSQLQNLSSQVFHYCCHVDGSSCPNSLGVVTLPEEDSACINSLVATLPEQSMDPANRKLKASPTGPGFCLSLHLTTLSTARHGLQ